MYSNKVRHQGMPIDQKGKNMNLKKEMQAKDMYLYT